jgi:hypothetical protein
LSIYVSSSNKGTFGRILVIAGSVAAAKTITEKLNVDAYAMFSEEAPTKSMRDVLPVLSNRHVFLVTPHVFTGPSFNGDVAMIISFSDTHLFHEIMALERHAAWSGCPKTVLFFRKTEPGLAKAAEVYSDLKAAMPFRM